MQIQTMIIKTTENHQNKLANMPISNLISTINWASKDVHQYLLSSTYMSIFLHPC